MNRSQPVVKIRCEIQPVRGKIYNLDMPSKKGRFLYDKVSNSRERESKARR